MPFYFIGGEDSDFTKIGLCSVDTATTAARRTAFARCSLKVGTTAAISDGWVGQFSSAQSSFWLTAKFYNAGTNAVANCDFIALMDSGFNRRISLSVPGGGGVIFLRKRNAAGTYTTLATSGIAMMASALVKLDMQVAYGTSGNIKVYLDGTLIIDYTGDVTTDGATTLSGFVLGSEGPAAGITSYWSEVIVSSVDTRSLALVTLPPLANGNAFTFTTGTTTNLSEVTLDDATLATSATAGQIAQSTITSSGVTGNPQIVAVAVNARAQKGTTGPSKADLGVRTASTDYWSPDIALPVTLDRISNVWETNPNTSAPWLYTDLTNAGFNIGMKSVT
jgi:hypothetical protein